MGLTLWCGDTEDVLGTKSEPFDFDAAWDAAGEDGDLETKARYVRTPEGARRFKRPIGSPIEPRVAAPPLALERNPEAESSLVDFLKMMDRRPAKDTEKFGNPAALLREHGRLWTPAEKPDDVADATPKLCFQNAFQLALARPDLTYVEGYALSIVPLHHAWCVTDDGVVVDPTWTGGNGLDPGDAYFGVPLTRDAVVEEALRTGYYGVLGHSNYGFWSEFDEGNVEAVPGGFEAKTRVWPASIDGLYDVDRALRCLDTGEDMPLSLRRQLSVLRDSGEHGEKALRRVRTPEGARAFDQPIGSVIRPDAPLPSSALDLLPPAGETTEAKANVKSVNDLISEGWDPADAVKEHKRLVHNEAVKLIRARQKAEKAKKDDQKDDQPKKAITPEELLKQVAKLDFAKTEDELTDIAADLASKVAGEQAPLPKAIYDFRPGKDNGPGACSTTYPWYHKVPATYKQGDPPIPVVGLTISHRHVEHGFVVKRGDVLYLVETENDGDDDGKLDARLSHAEKITEAVLKTVPDGSRHFLQGVALLTGPNPKDAYWAQKYGIAGFHSAATGGNGTVNVWDAHKSPVQPTTMAHEFGHNVDSQVWMAHQYLSEAAGPKLAGQTMSWSAAMASDRNRSLWVKQRTFTATRPGGHPITLGENFVSEYGSKSEREDFAESVRLYLKDRREGKIGFLKPTAGQSMGHNVRFADVWPERAKVLDAAFGVKSEYLTAAVSAMKAEARDLVADERHHQLVSGNASGTMQYHPNKLAVDYGMTLIDAHEVYATGVKLGEQKHKDALSQKKLKAVDSLFAAMMSALNAEQAEHGHDDLTNLAAGHLKNQGLTPSSFDLEDVIAQAQTKYKFEKDKFDAEQALAAATAEAAESAFSLLTIEDLPPDDKKKIRKKKAAVKFYAKKGGATDEEAQKAADEYEIAAVAQRMKDLGIKGPEDVGAAKLKSAGQTDTSTTKLGLVVPGHKHGLLTKAKDWLQKAGMTKNPNAKKQHYNAAMQAKDNLISELSDRLSQTEADWETFRTYCTNTQGMSSAYGNPVSTVPGPFSQYSVEQRRALIYQDMNNRVGCWAGTAGDSSLPALMMQHAVKDEFGLKADWGQRFLVQGVGGQYSGDKQKLLQDITNAYPKIEGWYRRVARTMYEHTQEEFAKEGIKEVALWRGMHIPSTLAWAGTGEHRCALQPANSWSTSKAIAHRFGPRMLKATFPVTLILGSARTGFGCLNEQEFCVMDADGLIRVEPYKASYY